ncbi:BlaI/MecI/CopY family transcriptional regulator [Cytophagales bacterium LB-30]|uniref:BlaI/MecI/CopY family transcriptional regulator n=1 Tax=Shiella aurantiaca TaxID=3058365 RepID=A0ABT8F0X6_9BACT|nr:BlaI/MecI/CopY family transcriptional regulator [Shiella aurantiaca]MDN4164098.1 BlaI/MecI/CopY family transcriptional regulator [Shiella aurantiaca]
MKELTKAEEQVMHLLWQLEKAYVKDIIELMPEPKPAYNTVSTIIRILETKEFVGHEAFGKTYRYFPLIKKETYTQFYMKNFLSGYFGGSFKKMVSFFTDKEEVNVKEMEEILQLMQAQIKQKKDG